MQKCVFLDRDGVINHDRVDYVYKITDLTIIDGVPEALARLKNDGYLIIVITNQSGINRQIFGERDVDKVHQEIQNRTGNLIDAFYFSQYHRTKTNSLASKPGSLLFEKAISKFKIDTNKSWMVGDRIRDLIPASSLGINTILVDGDYNEIYDGVKVGNLLEAVNIIYLNSK